MCRGSREGGRRIGRAIAGIIVIVGGSLQAESVRLRAGRSIALRDAGIRVRVLSGMEPTPLQLPSGQRFLRTEPSGEESQFLAYDPRDLWRHDQCLGRFVGEAGTMRIFDVRLAPPERMRRVHPAAPHVLRQVFRDAIRPLPNFRAASLRDWVEYLTGTSVVDQSGNVRGLFLHHPYVRFVLENEGPNDVPIYLIQVRRHPRRVVAVWIDLAPKEQYEDVDEAVFDVLKALRLTPRVGRRRAEGPDPLMQSRRPETGRRRDPAYRRTRGAVIRSIRNMQDWWFVETPQYVIAADLPSSRRAFVHDIQENLRAIRAAFRHLIPPQTDNSRSVSVVRIFDEREEFLKYLGDNPLKEWAIGLWMPGRDELAISPFEDAGAAADRRTMMQTIYHEGFHQYVHYALNGVAIPIWINEGHAAFFEGTDVDSRRRTLRVEEVEERAERLEVLLETAGDAPLGLRRLMDMSPAEFYAPFGRLERYSLAWGMVYFLRKASEQYPQRRYERLCDVTFKTCLQTGGDWRSAVRKSAAVVDMGQLEEDFRAFWSDRGRRKRAERRELFE